MARSKQREQIERLIGQITTCWTRQLNRSRTRQYTTYMYNDETETTTNLCDRSFKFMKKRMMPM